MDKASLKYFADRWRAASERAEILRIEVAEAIRAAHAEGMQQQEIVEATGYTRQQVRRIVKADPADT